MSKQSAWSWACRCYCKRVCGMGPPTTDGYVGDFDFTKVVDAAPTPSTSKQDNHRMCWAEMKRLFEREWEKQCS